MSENKSGLTRPIQPMPEDIKIILEKRGLMSDYLNRPSYQQNDYLGWIARAKLEKTRAKRINQMLGELEKGGVYMKMRHPSSAKERN
jgi:uncharacterized protein YdeI (YjbR/CyaY-like superfamily)